MTTYRKKLIEVALPLDAINVAAAKEKSIRHGHPSTLHLWWARRPLAACRAVLFSSLVDDPSGHPEKFPTKEAQDAERERLHDLIVRMVPWEATQDEALMKEVRDEILAATGGNPPAIYDPFSGGGSIPLEAQRLGLEAHASDLNPVPVLITKALIEIPPKFANQSPVNPESLKARLGSWKGAQGLAEDVRYYGLWMRKEAEKRIGHLYPKVKLPKAKGGGEATVIAWLWARTVRCPNPACGCMMPMVKSFALSTKKGKDASIEPSVDRSTTPPSIHFDVQDKPATVEGTIGRQGARCIACGESAPLTYVRVEGQAKRIGQQLMAIVAEGNRTRHFVKPDDEHIRIAATAKPTERPEEPLSTHPQYMGTPRYGLTSFGDLFTDRQLVALNTLCDLIPEAQAKAMSDALSARMPSGGLRLADGGSGAKAYGEAVGVYLSLGLSRVTDIGNALCRWENTKTQVRNLFARQALSMLWDYAETNIFGDAAGGFEVSLENSTKALAKTPAIGRGFVRHLNAESIEAPGVVFSSDPPYYDNVPYSDLSDFFYIWLRRCLKSTYPELLGTMLTPKVEELVADQVRYGGREAAHHHFEQGMGRVFHRMAEQNHPDYPVTLYYAFKQQEEDADEEDEGTDNAVASSGWETFLGGLVDQGFQVGATWPMRTELSNRMRGQGSNALASSIVLVCRPRPTSAKAATRREFLTALRSELPEAMRLLQRSHIAPVDLAQAAIGPGMGVFSRYAKVLEADGSNMSVRTALQLINKALDEFLTEQEGDFDGDSRWAVTWFDQHGFEEGPYGVAETLSKARNTSVEGLVDAGIIWSKAGKVRLLKREDLPTDWDPEHDARLTVWESVQHLIRVLESEGEAAAGHLLLKLGPMGDVVRELAYRLYALCERKKWSQEAQAYNGLIVSWGAVTTQASNAPRPTPGKQGSLELED